MTSESDTTSHDIALWFSKHVSPDNCYRAFEAYGYAMTAVSTFEMLMALMTMKATAQKLDKRAGSEIRPSDKPGLIRALLNRSYDPLRRELCKSYTLSPTLVEALTEAKEFRDNLAHNFWQANLGNLLSSDGVDIIATQCVSLADHFRRLAQALFEETGVTVDDYIEMLTSDPQRDAKVEGWREMLRSLGLH